MRVPSDWPTSTPSKSKVVRLGCNRKDLIITQYDIFRVTCPTNIDNVKKTSCRQVIDNFKAVKDHIASGNRDCFCRGRGRDDALGRSAIGRVASFPSIGTQKCNGLVDG
jgi:hypothetical protein